MDRAKLRLVNSLGRLTIQHSFKVMFLSYGNISLGRGALGERRGSLERERSCPVTPLWSQTLQVWPQLALRHTALGQTRALQVSDSPFLEVV